MIKTSLSITLILILLTLSACGGKSIHQYTADAADATKSFLDAAKVLFDSKLISKDTYLSMLSAAETANKDTDAFKVAAVQFGTITVGNKQTLMDKISDAITAFKPVAATVISDPAQQAKFNSIVGLVQVALAGILAALAAIKNPTPVTPKIVADLNINDHSIGFQIGNEFDRIAPRYEESLPDTCSIGSVVRIGTPEKNSIFTCLAPAEEWVKWETEEVR